MVNKKLKQMNQTKLLIIITLLFLFSVSSCGDPFPGIEISKLTPAEKNVLYARKKIFDTYINENHPLTNPSTTKDEAVLKMLQGATQGNISDYICNKTEYIKIFYPNQPGKIIYSPARTPENVWKMVSLFRRMGEQELTAKFKDKTVKDIKIDWKEPEARRSIQVHKIKRAVAILDNGEVVKLDGVKIVIQKGNDYKVCVVNTD